MSWQDLNWVDYTILGVVAFSTLISLVRGFIKEAISLIIWITAFWASFVYAKPVAASFLQSVASESARVPLAFIIVFLSVLIVGAIVNYMIGRLVYSTGLSGTDRVLGVVFGIARGVFLIAVIVLVAPLTAAPKSDWWRDSQLIPQFEGLAEWLHAILPDKIDGLLKPIEEMKGATTITPVPAAVPAAPAPSVTPTPVAPATPVVPQPTSQ